MILFRSLIFHGLFYLLNAAQFIFWLPVFFILPRRESWKMAKFWAYSLLWLQHKIIGSTYEFRGQENFPDDPGLIFASKHQSNWETYTSILFLADPVFVLKRILVYIPLFGWYMQKMDIVPVDRGKRGIALASMTKHAKSRFKDNRQIIIYPEGTRKPPGAEPAYKYGIIHLYKELDPTVLPVALNSGLFWPKKSVRIYPGKITMEFLPPIEAGLEKDEFRNTLEERIETATNRLFAEAIDHEPSNPAIERFQSIEKSA